MTKRNKLKEGINKYGTLVSTKDFITKLVSIITFVLIVSYLLKLNNIYLIIIIVTSLIIIPFIIYAWSKNVQEAKKFAELTDYLSNIIPIFMQKSKIRYVLSELSEICSGHIKEKIDEAIIYIDNTINDNTLAKNALKIIEDEYPNSRIKSVHNFLLSVEASSSINYKDVANNLYDDVEGWIKRTYSFKKDILNRRNKLIILCLMTLFMDLMFVYVYGTNSFFSGFTNNSFYQISTVIFVLSIESICGIVLYRLNGDWLINDSAYKNEDILKKKYDSYKKGQKRSTVVDIILTIIFIGISIYFIVIEYVTLALIPLAFAYFSLTHSKRKYRSIKKYIVKNITLEFPIWLREVSLNLGTLTVINAIEYSYNSLSYPLRKEVRKFLNNVTKNPSSIVAYNDFLTEYDLVDARSSMRVLYAINNVKKVDMKERVSKLIVRNQELLAKAESLKNEDAIGGIEALGYLPTIIFSIQIMVSMVIMFFYMMANLSGGTNL